SRTTAPSTRFKTLLRRGQQAPKPPNRPEEVHSNGRFVEARHAADFSRRPSLKMTQHEDHALPFRQLRKGGRQLLASLFGEDVVFRAWATGRHVLGQVTFLSVSIEDGWCDPSLPTAPGLQPVQAPVDQDAREPHLKGQFLAKRPDRSEEHTSE